MPLSPDERRRRIEELLSPEELGMIEGVMDTLARPFATWPRLSGLRIHLELVAVERLADELQRGGPRGPAVERACSQLGIPLETHRARIKRARCDAFTPQDR